MGDSLNLTSHDHNDRGHGHSHNGDGHGHSHGGDGHGHSHSESVSHSSINVDLVSQSVGKTYLDKFQAMSKDKKIALIVGISLTILALGSILFAVVEKSRQPYEIYEGHCAAVAKHQRFDCSMATIKDTEYLCRKRDCCWDATAIGNAPKCFSSSFKYRGYKVVSENHTNYGINLKLRRHQKDKYFESEVDDLDCIISYETDSRVHVKIVDPSKERYEVPVDHEPGTMGHRMQYVIGITKKVFGFSISRTHSNNTVINTTLPGLMFSDQYLSLSMALSSTNVYGLGEDRGSLRRNMEYEYHSMWSAGDSEKQNFGSHPFFLNMEKNGHASGVLLLNSNAMDVILTPYPAVTFRTTGGVLDFYIFLGPTPADVISQYTEQIGRPMMPPYWSLGYHLGKEGSVSTEELNKTIQSMRSNKIPFDSIWTDNDIMLDYKSFTVKPAFSKLSDLVNDLHNHGQHYVPVVDAAIKVDKSYDIYTEGLKADVFIDDTNGDIVQGTTVAGTAVFPDFFNPAVEKWWGNALSTLRDIAQYGGVWLNDNEPYTLSNGGLQGCSSDDHDIPPYKIDREHDLSQSTLCPSALHYKEQLHYNLHNIYGWKQTKVTDRVLRGLTDSRLLIMSRSTFPGSGVSGGHWLGDNNATWQDMKSSIAGILNFNMYGISLVGADVCGYHGDATEELCVRWHQLGALSPFFRNFNSVNSKDQSPTSFSDVGTKRIVAAINTRYTLLPTLYTLFYQAHISGSPVARPLFFEFPDDPELSALDTQYLLGTGLMVAPTLDPGVTDLQVYFPAACWYDFWDGDLVSSESDPGYQTVNTSMDRINLFVRGGTILTLAEPGLTTQHVKDPALQLRVYLEKMSAVGSVYFDDGVTQDAVSKGRYLTVGITATHEKVTSSVSLLYPGHHTTSVIREICVMGLGKGPDRVLVDGVEIPPSNYTYTAQKKMVMITDLSLPIRKAFCVEYA